MLVTRTPRESLYISLAPGADPLSPVAVLFRQGPLRARVAEIRGFRVGISLQLPPQLQVHDDDPSRSAFSHCGTEGRTRGIFLLSRHLLESVAITPEAGVPSTMPVGRLFRRGPLELHVIDLRGRNVRLGLRAPRMLHIHRRELPERTRVEPTPAHAFDAERSSRAGAPARGLMRELPRELLIGNPSPPAMSVCWMRRTPPDL